MSVGAGFGAFRVMGKVLGWGTGLDGGIREEGTKRQILTPILASELPASPTTLLLRAL